MGLFGRNIAPGETAGMPDEWWERVMPMPKIGGVPTEAGGGTPMPQEPQPQAPQQNNGIFGRVGNFLANPNPLFGAGTAILAASGNPVGEGLFAFQQQARKNRDDDIDRQYKQAQVEYLRNKPQQMSTAARMAAEMGLKPGTPEYVQFIRRYAFKPTILQIPNAAGGTDYQEYDPSGGGQAPSLQPGHVEDGYIFMGGDPSNPNSWRQQ